MGFGSLVIKILVFRVIGGMVFLVFSSCHFICRKEVDKAEDFHLRPEIVLWLCWGSSQHEKETVESIDIIYMQKVFVGVD